MGQRFEHAARPEVETLAAVSAESVREELRRILASPLFLNARRPTQFLRFIVESTLGGGEDRIKEYLIGVEVFDRPAAYDPKDDPVVRIEAGRLRKKLADYYRGPGANDALIIELPKGGYIPAFLPRTGKLRPAGAEPPLPEQAGLMPRRAKRSWALPAGAAALALMALLALVSTYYVRVRHRSSVAPASIAVLPFLNLSGSSAGEYLSDGISEELTTGLAQFKGLRVVAATSAFQFRGKSEDVRKIGQALNAEALVEGSITQSAGSLRINAQLVDARNGYHLWSKVYDVPAGDMLASEQDIVQQTARSLGLPLTASLRPMKLDTENPEAHDLYLQGRYLWNTRQLPDMLESLRLFQHAIQDDPNYVLAYAGLADTYTVMAVNSQMSPAEALPHARAALHRALELDPNLAQAHATLGLLESQCEWNWHGAEREFRKAIELQPNYAPAHHWAGLNYMQMGQFAAADAEFRQAQVFDPLSPMISEGLAENFYQARHYDEAITTVRNMPNPKVGWVILVCAYIFKGMYQEALQVPEVSHATDLNGFLLKAEVLVRSGDRAGGLKMLADVERKGRNPGASQDYIPPGYLAWAYAMAGESEQAFTWLEKAYQQHDPTLANLKTDPGFDILRSDPRYVDLLKKVGLSD